MVVNFAELVSAAEPWVGYAIQNSEHAGDKKESQRIATKVMTTLKVLQSYGSATWRENGVTVTHSVAVFKDTPPGGK
ncbi:MAG TPA: hypothetical protein VGJ05_05890 [Fimbriiglobus sp.]